MSILTEIHSLSLFTGINIVLLFFFSFFNLIIKSLLILFPPISFKYLILSSNCAHNFSHKQIGNFDQISIILSLNSSRFLIFFFESFSFNIAHTFSMGLKSGELGGHSIYSFPNKISITAFDSCET